jgi:hypothetical protein
MAYKTCNYAIVGCDADNGPCCLGFAETQKQAIEVLERTEHVGCEKVAAFDGGLRELLRKVL